MPISIRRDCAPIYGYGNRFSLKQNTMNFFMGSYLSFVRRAVADRNYDAFHDDWNINFASLSKITERNLTEALALRVNLTPAEVPNFHNLWEVAHDATKYKDKKDTKARIEADLQDAYDLAGRVAAGVLNDNGPLTWERIEDAPPGPNYVVFSDHHMMDFDGFTLPNFFKDHNLQLYLDVLNHYAANPSWCLIENGDVEECIIHDFDAGETELRKDSADKFPIKMSDPDWDAFMTARYNKRESVLTHLLYGGAFNDYYDLLTDVFVPQGRFVRLTGNHDTYSNIEREVDLKRLVEGRLGVPVQDVCRIKRGGETTHLVMHGHQFDTVSIQSGDEPFAPSLGEVFSETLSWIYEGPDRFWDTDDTKVWMNGGSFENVLARETPMDYDHGSRNDLIFNGTNNIKSDPKGFVETLLQHEIAWEYFENSDGFQALANEVATGDEWFKFRHLNERTMCERYAARYLHHKGAPFNGPIPKLVLGHTHEPRDHAAHPEDGPTYWYLNSGSAGRFSNLIWAVEITESEDRIVSWSHDKGQLKKITWEAEPSSVTVPNPMLGPQTYHSSKLVHRSVTYY